jgi:uncharacterized protein YndB with AHSA1/START domain
MFFLGSGDGRIVMVMRESASARMTSSPERVFTLITDPSMLPSWNRAIIEVVEAPEALERGSVWTIRLHALSQSWVSKSHVSVIDRASGFFAYRSQTDDGNTSYADWEWHVQPDQDGSKVTVTVELNPTTFWRKRVLIRIRRPALRREMRDSLSALSAAAGS